MSEPTALSLIPPAVVLTLAIWLRRPILALLIGACSGLLLLSPTVTTSALTGLDDQFFRVISSTREYAITSARYHAQRSKLSRLAAILDLMAPKSKKAADPKASGDCMVRVVAGVGFEPTTFRL